MDLEQRVDDFLRGDEEIMDENANKDSKVFGTQRDLLAGVVSKEYALNKLLPPDVAQAHRDGWIHFHDLDYTLTGYYNCMLIDFPKMLSEGFRMGGASIESPKSLRTAAEIIPQIIVNVASNIYGGVSAHKIDEILEPYADMSYRKHLKESLKFALELESIVYTEDELNSLIDQIVEGSLANIDSKFSENTVSIAVEHAQKKMKKEIYDSCQSLEYEINCVFSSNGQTPFITFNFGQTTSIWGREIQKAILQVRIDGLGAEKRTAVFPKLVFTLKDGVNLKPEDPNYDVKQLALECASKRIYPDILSYDKLMEIYGYFISPMGCRSFLPKFINDSGEEMSYGRRNIGVCSLNLPNIALSTDAKEDFFKELDDRIQLIFKALMYRYESLASVKPRNAPILYSYGATGHRLNADDSVQEIFRNGEATASIGYIGLHEVAVRFFGENWQDNPEAKEFTIQVLKRMGYWRDIWKNETGIEFSVYSTPAESLTDRFCKMDKERFGDVKGITDKSFYMNSFHLDVAKKVDPFTKIDFEEPYPKIATGGHIVYVEQPSLAKNLKALEAIWDYAYTKVPYFGVNQPISRCFACGYEGDFDADVKGFYCPQCSNRDSATLEVVERLCGYLSTVSERKPINGRIKEMTSRVKHS